MKHLIVVAVMLAAALHRTEHQKKEVVMHKRLIAVAALVGLAVSAHAQYIQGLWTKGNPVYVTAGGTFTTDNLAGDAAVTTVALAYHPLSAGSLWDLPAVAAHEPDWLKPILPRESWACSIGGAWNSSAKAGVFGCGINILDSVRQEASNLLALSNNDRLNALGKQIAPGNGPANIYVARVEQNSADRPLVFVPRWLFAASYGF